VVFAIFAGSTIAVLQRDSSVAARIGRRGMMLAAVAAMMLAMAVLAVWKDLPGLLIGRVITGVSVGLAAGIAITYLVELRLRADPKASVVQARTIGTSVTIGALGVGPLVAGCLAQWVPQPLTVAYLVFAANGLFAGLSGLFLATTLHQHSLALSGAALFLLFSCGVVSQLATARLPASRVLTLGTISMLAGLVLLVVSVRLSTPSLALFLISGALIGAGSGAVFKGTSGVALDLGASAPNTVLGFAILVGLGVVVSGWALLGRRP
jgi:MFS family permease